MTTIPTIGFNVESVEYKNIKFQVSSQSVNIKVSANQAARYGILAAKLQYGPIGGVITPTHKQSVCDPSAGTALYSLTRISVQVIFVVDSSDRERLPTSKAELLSMLSEDELKDAKLLVFANKQVRLLTLEPSYLRRPAKRRVQMCRTNLRP